MKYLITFALSSLTLLCFGQNSVPQIEITNIDRDEIMETLTINYSLNDADADLCEVWLKMSLDGGIYFETVSQDKITGDIGSDIIANETHSMTWDYSELTEGIESVTIRIFASDNQVVDIGKMVSQVNEAELLSTLESIIGERHFETAPERLAEVRTLIKDAFSDANLQTESHDFVFSNTNMQNILGRKPGTKDEDITYIIDGHFDGVLGSPAADDNGSAVAGMLVAMRILSQYSFEHSIRFIGFDAEELGLIGSQNYVLNGIKPFENVQGVFNFEMIGFYSDEPNSQQTIPGFEILFPEAIQEMEDDDYRGNFIFGIGNTASNPLLSSYVSASKKYVPELRLITLSLPGAGEIAPDLRRSDHASFWDGGIPALFIVDGGDFRNPNYHAPGDDISTLNFEFMKNVVKATLATVAELAIPINATFDEADLSAVLSINDHDHQFPTEIFIFSNPSSNGLLSLRVEESKIGFRARAEVYELTGKRVYRDIINFTAGTNNSEIDLHNLATGSYILVLYSENATKSLGFVIAD
ncbi:M28 family peptidase [Aquimarina sp. RZ0]|uniref:M28 family peptidase n=1 Tax=Aquimarina sp. RZ0 TaxID=2607730 RepID=UPI0011F13007|nr:M28 family peptidase [Aquimarina sp. RZ0]KAA1242139.1 M28 family peptidase [Aquimarina sp. RZ0]